MDLAVGKVLVSRFVCFDLLAKSSCLSRVVKAITLVLIELSY